MDAIKAKAKKRLNNSRTFTALDGSTVVNIIDQRLEVIQEKAHDTDQNTPLISQKDKSPLLSGALRKCFHALGKERGSEEKDDSKDADTTLSTRQRAYHSKNFNKPILLEHALPLKIKPYNKDKSKYSGPNIKLHEKAEFERK